MRKSIHTSEYASLCEELRAGPECGVVAAGLGRAAEGVAELGGEGGDGERRIDLVEFKWFLGACGADTAAVFGRVAKEVWSQATRAVRKRGR